MSFSSSGLSSPEVPRFWQISKPYLNQEGQIMPTALLLPPPDFQTFLRPCPCKVDDDNDTALFDHARALGDRPSQPFA